MLSLGLNFDFYLLMEPLSAGLKSDSFLPRAAFCRFEIGFKIVMCPQQMPSFGMIYPLVNIQKAIENGHL